MSGMGGEAAADTVFTLLHQAWDMLGIVGILGLGGTFGIPGYIFVRGRRKHKKIKMQMVTLMMDWLENCSIYYRESGSSDGKDLLLEFLAGKRITVYDLLLAHTDSFKIASIMEMMESMNMINVYLGILRRDPDNADPRAVFGEYIEYIKQHLLNNYPKEYKKYNQKHVIKK